MSTDYSIYCFLLNKFLAVHIYHENVQQRKPHSLERYEECQETQKIVVAHDAVHWGPDILELAISFSSAVVHVIFFISGCAGIHLGIRFII